MPLIDIVIGSFSGSEASIFLITVSFSFIKSDCPPQLRTGTSSVFNTFITISFDSDKEPSETFIVISYSLSPSRSLAFS